MIICCSGCVAVPTIAKAFACDCSTGHGGVRGFYNLSASRRKRRYGGAVQSKLCRWISVVQKHPAANCSLLSPFAGATRLELCANLLEGGTTPSLGLWPYRTSSVCSDVFPTQDCRL